jgi:predicted transposase/invertase (TIGR01784 family)
MEHDNSYKLLFSEPEIVADLLKGFVHESWVAYLDFSTLEKISTHFISDDLRSREDDIIWRVKCKDEWLYIYLLIEFQSTIDYFMSVRLMTYIGLLYQDLIKQLKLGKNDKLPPIFPVVLYNGKSRWTATTQLSQLIQNFPTGFNQYKPSLSYLVLDEGCYSETKLKPLKNLVAAIFRLENSTNETQMLNVINDLLKWLVSPEQIRIRRVFNIWIKRVLLKSNKITQAVNNLTNLTEVKTMLAENVANWHKQWEIQGMEKGIEKGIEKGKAEKELQMLNEQRLMFKQLITTHFNPSIAESSWKLLQHVNTSAVFAQIAECLFQCKTGEQLLESMRSLSAPKH